MHIWIIVSVRDGDVILCAETVPLLANKVHENNWLVTKNLEIVGKIKKVSKQILIYVKDEISLSNFKDLN